MKKVIVFAGLVAGLYSLPSHATNYCCDSGYHPNRGVIVRHKVDVDNHNNNDVNNKNHNNNNNANNNANNNSNKNRNKNANNNSNKNANNNKNNNSNKNRANANANANANAKSNSNANAVSNNENVNHLDGSSKAIVKNENLVKTDLTNSGNSNVANNVDVTLNPHQGQNQNQSQFQAQTQAVENSGNSSNQNQSSAQGNSTNVTIEGDTYQARRIPVATAYAPNLTAGEFTCLGSVSGGIQTGVLGLSGGKTTVDQNCVMIRQVYMLQQMGQYKAACERAKQDPSIRAAMEAAGSQCEDPSDPEPVAEVDTSNFATKQDIEEVDQRASQRTENLYRHLKKDELK